MKEWIFVLAEKDRDALGTIRTMYGLMAAEHEDEIWVRGLTTASAVDMQIKQLPLLCTWLLDNKNRLFHQDRQTPERLLPALEWTELNKFITVEVPTSAMPGKTAETVKVQLVKSSVPQKGEALITTLSALKQYAETAPQSRLEAIKFAVSADGTTLITGNPLLPISGREYWRNNGLLLPCGYDFEYTFTAPIIGRKLNPAGKDEILFDTAGNWQKIPAGDFVKATRSGVRLTQLLSRP